jgi:hypothetical protein
MIKSAQWVDAGNTIVKATIDGVEWSGIRMTEQSELQRQVQDWIDAGNEPDPLPPKVVPTLDSVSTGKTAAEILGAA